MHWPLDFGSPLSIGALYCAICLTAAVKRLKSTDSCPVFSIPNAIKGISHITKGELVGFGAWEEKGGKEVAMTRNWDFTRIIRLADRYFT